MASCIFLASLAQRASLALTALPVAMYLLMQSQIIAMSRGSLMQRGR